MGYLQHACPADTAVLLPRAELLSAPSVALVYLDLLLESLTWGCSLPRTDMPAFATHIPTISYKPVSNRSGGLGTYVLEYRWRGK